MMQDFTQSLFYPNTCTVNRPPVTGSTGLTAVISTPTPCTVVYPMDRSKWDVDMESTFKGHEIQLETTAIINIGDIVTISSQEYTVIDINRWPKLFLSTNDVYDVLLEERKSG